MGLMPKIKVYNIDYWYTVEILCKQKRPEFKTQAFSVHLLGLIMQPYWADYAAFSFGTKMIEAITARIKTPPTIDNDKGEEIW